MTAFVDDHRQAHGVEPICTVLPDRPSRLPARMSRAVGIRREPRRAGAETPS